MAKARLTLLLLASTSSLLMGLSHADAQTGVRAVEFSGAGCLFNTNVQASLSSSSMLEISAWSGYQTIARGTTQNILSSNTNGPGATNVVDLHIDNVAPGDPNLTPGSHLFFLTTDGTAPGAGQQYSQWVSDELIPPYGWHHIFIASDTSQTFSNGTYTVVAFLDGIELTPNSALTHGNTVSQNFFSTPYFKNNLNNAWHVGCYYDTVLGQRSSYLDSDLAEVYVAQLTSATYPDLTPFGEFKRSGMWGPKELGDYCLAPYPGGDPPLICLRGGAANFSWSLYPSVFSQFTPYPNSFTTPTASDDPFSFIQ